MKETYINRDGSKVELTAEEYAVYPKNLHLTKVESPLKENATLVKSGSSKKKKIIEDN